MTQLIVQQAVNGRTTHCQCLPWELFLHVFTSDRSKAMEILETHVNRLIEDIEWTPQSLVRECCHSGDHYYRATGKKYRITTKSFGEQKKEVESKCILLCNRCAVQYRKHLRGK